MFTRGLLSLALSALLAGCGSVTVAEPSGSSSSTRYPAPCSGAGCTGVARLSTGVPRCVVRKNGDAVCWGGPFPGGDAPTDDPPYAIPELHDAVAAAGLSNQMCFLRASGRVACLGANVHGEVGSVPISESTDVPRDVPGVEGAVEIAAGLDFTCARLASGKVLCWGAPERLGASLEEHPGPVAVLGLDDAVSLAAGYDHTCAARTHGEVVCWGKNNAGDLGNGTSTEQQLPITVPGVLTAVEIAAGWSTSCARLATGQIACWGGDFMLDTPPPPAVVEGSDDALEMSASYERACALRPQGEVVCWGDATGKAIHVYLDGPALQIAVGPDRACAALTNGEVWCWTSTTPALVKGL